jgi:iron complex outermembrane receptor protein
MCVRAAVTLLVAAGPFDSAAVASANEREQVTAPRLTELTLEQLGDIQVTSVSKRPEEVWRTAVAIYVITREDIRRSAATSIPEVLRLAPGLEVARIDSDHWAIGVRGFGDQFSKSLLVLIDGRSIYTPLFAGMYWPAHDTLLEDVDRIEVIRGPGGTIWGANAVNGVINIITRSAAETHGTMVSAGAGTIDRGSGALRYGGGNGRTFDYRVYGKGVDRGAEHHTDGANFDEWWTGQAGFRADWAVRPGDSLTLQGDVSKGRHGQLVNAASYSPPSTVALDGHLDATGVNVLARWQRDVSSGRGFTLQAYYDRTSWLAPHFGEKRDTVDVDFVHHVTLARRHALSAGGGARFSPSEFIQTIPTLDFSPRRASDTVYSGFAEDRVELVRDRFWLTAGSKVEHNSYTGVEVEPSLRVLWTPRPGQSLWSAVTRAVRTPSRIEDALVSTSFASITATGVPVFLRFTGNPDFAAERIIGYEAGYRARLASQAYVDLAVFHDRHRGLSSFGGGRITVEQSPPPVHAVYNVQYVNGVSGTSDGFELAPDWQPVGWWQLRGSYSFVRFDLAIPPSSIDLKAVARYSGSSPHHQARLQSLVNLPGGGEVDASYRYVSALPAQNVAAYHEADLRFGWAVSPALELSVAGQNLLSPYHVEFGHGTPPAVGIARSIYVEMKWRRARP